jgi:hypothetical protein
MRITIECDPAEVLNYDALLDEASKLFLEQGFHTLGYDMTWKGDPYYGWVNDKTLSYGEILERVDTAEHKLTIENSPDPSKWDQIAFMKREA